jgi:ribosomal protein S18 acetylase RimI-like enzyme
MAMPVAGVGAGVAPAVRVAPARGAADLSAAARLFRAYAEALAVDLGFQGFEAELAGLPGRYAPPAGALLLARRRGAAIGCVAMRPLAEAGVCEMKRLYVAPEGRGLGVGRALVAAVIDAGVRAGHREMRLDTLPDMEAALALYRDMGFGPTRAYYDTPLAGTVFLARRLDGGAP